MKDEKMVASFDGTELRLRKDLVPEPKALIVIAHGLCEHLNRYDHFTERLNEQGYSVYRFDQRGHGKSKGDKVFFGSFNEMPDDTNVIIDMAREESEGKKVFLFGHSLSFSAMSFPLNLRQKAMCPTRWGKASAAIPQSSRLMSTIRWWKRKSPSVSSMKSIMA